MAEHTELPWAIADGEGCERIVVERGTNNILFVLREPYGRMPIPQDAQIPANAAFIVKACNSHEALVKALDAAIHVINIVRSPGSYTADNVLEDAERTFDETVDALRTLTINSTLLAAREVKP